MHEYANTCFLMLELKFSFFAKAHAMKLLHLFLCC